MLLYNMLLPYVLHVFALRTTHGHEYITVARLLVLFSLSLTLLIVILLVGLSILKPVGRLPVDIHGLS